MQRQHLELAPEAVAERRNPAHHENEAGLPVADPRLAAFNLVLMEFGDSAI